MFANLCTKYIYNYHNVELEMLFTGRESSNRCEHVRTVRIKSHVELTPFCCGDCDWLTVHPVSCVIVSPHFNLVRSPLQKSVDAALSSR